MATCTVCSAEVADDQVAAHMSDMHPSTGDSMEAAPADSAVEADSTDAMDTNDSGTNG